MLKTADDERTNSNLELPSGPIAPGSNGDILLARVTLEICILKLDSPVVSSTKNLMWSPSIVTGLVEFEI